MPKRINYQQLTSELKLLFNLNRKLSSRQAIKALAISQASFSRLITLLKDQVIKIGKAGNTEYVLLRIGSVNTGVPLYEINEGGKTFHQYNLFEIEPKGYFLKAKQNHLEDLYFEDLPYFLDDLRPNGFLGRQLPKRHPELNLPGNIKQWNGTHCINYLTHEGWNNFGNYILGQSSLKKYLQAPQSNNPYPEKEKIEVYELFAQKSLELGEPGSSAMGEFPKFLYRNNNAQNYLVKFTPTLDNAISQRRKELLICEHLSLSTLRKHGIPAAESEILHTKQRTFLQLKRFDRSEKGRIGLITLHALDAEFTGVLSDWMATSKELLTAKVLSSAHFKKICWLDLFNKLIANTDMHSWNLSFTFDNFRVLDVAPVYDSLPMLYAPQQEELVVKKFKPTGVEIEHASVWQDAQQAAIEFWQQVSTNQHLSPYFQNIGRENLIKIKELASIFIKLPEG